MPAGTLRDGVLAVDLEARAARWVGEPSDLASDAVDPTLLTVLAFSEADGRPTIPGPLIRAPRGTEVRIRIRNSLPDSVAIGLPLPALRDPDMVAVATGSMIVHGLRAGTVANDTIHVARGAVREVRFRADEPGTYLYRAAVTDRPLEAWSGRDAQLAGAIIVDPEGIEPDPEERIFVITMLDQYPDADGGSPDEMVRRAINGRSWPDTERLDYALGDTVRWRWVNASFESHPMHLHGFHYRLLARGNGSADTTFARARSPLVVTEHMKPGSTFRMEWIPERAGNWIFHCHILDHIVPAIERDAATIASDEHDVEQHALDAMAGLVLGMTVSHPDVAAEDTAARRRLRVLAQERVAADGRTLRGFVLSDSIDPPQDSVPVPSAPLVLTRGETTAITVVNHLSEPTTIHWHGLELESVYDGVAGWSRTGPLVAPLIAPGDSFVVRITPPRAGTFIYHTHMDETNQLVQGMAAPFIVLEPGDSFDPERDRVFIIGGMPEGGYPVNLDGRIDPPHDTFRVGVEYRLRFIHITRGLDVDLELGRDSVPERWRPVAKDGADLPPGLRGSGAARLETNTGETFDFLWTPTEPGDLTLSVAYDMFSERRRAKVSQTFRVR